MIVMHCACNNPVEPMADREGYFYCERCKVQTNSVEHLSSDDLRRIIRGALREWTGVDVTRAH